MYSTNMFTYPTMRGQSKNLMTGAIFFSILASGCSADLETKKLLIPGIHSKSKMVKVKETQEVSITCNKEGIKQYQEKGWKVISSSTKEVPCTWKTVKATKNCNLKHDKGCAITVPDIMGEKIIYKLEKTSKVKK